MRAIDASLFAVYSFKTPDGYDDDSYTAGVVRVLEDMDEAPTLDYKDLVPQGEWVMRGGKLYCTHCGKKAGVARDSEDFWYTKGTYFCPNCGAKVVEA